MVSLLPDVRDTRAKKKVIRAAGIDSEMSRASMAGAIALSASPFRLPFRGAAEGAQRSSLGLIFR